MFRSLKVQEYKPSEILEIQTDTNQQPRATTKQYTHLEKNLIFGMEKLDEHKNIVLINNNK